MAKKKKDEKKTSFLNEDQQKSLEKMAKEMIDIAAAAVDEYENLDLSSLTEFTSSITQIHEDSPYLNELFTGDSWKKVINAIPDMPVIPGFTDVENKEKYKRKIKKKKVKRTKDDTK